MFFSRTSRIAADSGRQRWLAYCLTSSNSRSLHLTVVLVVIGIEILPFNFYLASADCRQPVFRKNILIYILLPVFRNREGGEGDLYFF